jgi:hypothetical protein
MNNEELFAAQSKMLESFANTVLPKPQSREQLLESEKRHWLNVAAVNSLAYFIKFVEENSNMDIEQRQEAAAIRSIGYARALVEKLYQAINKENSAERE